MNDTILRVYDWKSDEFLLVDWYSNLVTSGDMYLAFAPDMRYMSNFLGFFKPPRTLAYANDDKGMWFAFWLEPVMNGAFFGVWIREDKRHTTSALRCLSLAFDESFKFASVLIAYSKQEALRATLEKLGATHGMTIPALWAGTDVDVYTLTKNDWESRHGERRKE